MSPRCERSSPGLRRRNRQCGAEPAHTEAGRYSVALRSISRISPCWVGTLNKSRRLFPLAMHPLNQACLVGCGKAAVGCGCEIALHCLKKQTFGRLLAGFIPEPLERAGSGQNHGSTCQPCTIDFFGDVRRTWSTFCLEIISADLMRFEVEAGLTN